MPLAPSRLTRCLLLLALLAATILPAAAQPDPTAEARVAALSEAHGGAVPAGLSRSVTDVLNEDAKLTASDAAEGDQFGLSVSLAGDRALVGTIEDDVGNDSGSAYIFVRDVSGAWSEEAKLTASDVADGDAFGFSVSLAGDRALVGAFEDDDGAIGSGSAYVFVRDGSGAWSQEAKLTANDADTEDEFGFSVSLAGDRALVGAPSDDVGGGAYVFVRDGSGAWSQEAKLTASDAAAFDFFGYSVSLAGDRALVGARGDDGAIGSAYVFVRDGSGAWSQEAKLTANDAESGDSFGFSVSLAGDRALVGARLDDDGGNGSGAAYVFVRDGFGAWSQEAKLTANDAESGDSFGWSVSLAGDRALVGANLDDGGGSAYVFVRDASDAWSEKARLTASDAEAGDEFGLSVSLAGDRALVGDRSDDDGSGGVNSGSAYVFDLIACAPGTLSDTGFEPCIPAPPGSFVAEEGATEATPCDLGTFQPDEGQTSCILAPIGFYVDVTGATMATACPDGETTEGEGSTSIDDCFDPNPMSFDLEVVNTDPTGSPIVTPQGSSVLFDYTITNNTANPTAGDFWFTAEREGNTVARGVIISGTIAPTTTLSSSFVQGVPGFAPVGTYTYTLHIGRFPDFIADADTFAVEVGAGSGVAGGTETWTVQDVMPWREAASPEAASSEAVPEAFALEAAYPNPFAERAVIGYAVPEAANVRLAVYDVLGRAVAVLADGQVEPGRYEAVLDGRGLPSGSYLVRLDAGGTVHTQQITLVR